MMADKKIIKVDDLNVAVISENRAIHSKETLLAERLRHVKRIAEIDELLAVLTTV